jgi:predicted RNase H-like HicB family nuclease
MKIQFTYWKEPDGWYLGYLNQWPDHWTQGEDLEDLKAHLKDLYHTFSKEDLPGIKRVDEIDIT